MVNYESAGARIRTVRTSKNLSQLDLAFLVNTGPVTVSHIECGNSKHRLEKYIDIANALGITLDTIFFDSLTAATKVCHNEISDMLKDCTDDEIRFVHKMVPAMIEAYRANKNIASDKKE